MTLTLVSKEIEEYAQAHTEVPAPLFEELRQITWAQMSAPQMQVGRVEGMKALQGPFDLAFIDADKGNYGNYYDAILPLLRPGGLLVADNTLWSGRVLHPRSADDHAIVAFNGARWDDARAQARVRLGARGAATG